MLYNCLYTTHHYNWNVNHINERLELLNQTMVSEPHGYQNIVKWECGYLPKPLAVSMRVLDISFA